MGRIFGAIKIFYIAGAILLGSCSAMIHDIKVPITTTAAVSSTHAGWGHIKAVGAKSPVSQSGMSTVAAKVTLTWNEMTVASGTIDSYNIYRATSSGGQNFSSPLSTGISSSTRSYEDSSVIGSQTYYYVVALVVSGAAALPTATAFSEAKVIVPPSNMVLVHRWMANQEMCGLMGKTADSLNNYRCPYTGPGGTGTQFDIGASYFVDAYELGCNYNPAPACADATNGCLGTAAPGGGVGNVGDVYYNRGDSNCYIKTGAATWTSANTSSLLTSERTLLASNKPGLPPLASVDQNRSYESCTAQSEAGFGSKKLPTHQQQIVAGAWSADLDDTTIGTIEAGTNHPVTGHCNANSANGLTFDGFTTPADLDTLPGTLASGIKSIRTGSASTANCVSRYGVQDFVGNVREWASDQLGLCSAVTHSCPGITSTIDATNTHWNGFNFDGTIGPGGGAVNVTVFNLALMSFSATRFLVPLGVPMSTTSAASYDSQAIGSGTGQFPTAKFHGDYFYLYTDNGGASRGAVAGARWNDTTQNGRFTLSVLYAPTFNNSLLGTRCYLAAE